jgi:hypothetical protein
MNSPVLHSTTKIARRSARGKFLEVAGHRAGK